MKEIKEETKMEKYTMFMDWKTRYSQNEYATQSNLQIQCNPYQATNGTFHRTRIISQFVWKYKNKTKQNKTKPSNSQSNLQKEKWNWINQPV